MRFVRTATPPGTGAGQLATPWGFTFGNGYRATPAGQFFWNVLWESPRDDSTYIQSLPSPTSEKVEFNLLRRTTGIPLQDPGRSGDGANHHIRIALYKTGAGGDRIDVKAELFSVAPPAVYATRTFVDIPSGVSLQDWPLTDAEADSIPASAYPNLFLRLTTIRG